jgi:hypothetical protein
MAGVNIPMIQSSDMTTRRLFMGSSVAALVQAAQTNPLIQGSRDAALAVLKPSVKQLEHGLGLHAQSLVVTAWFR